jgi:hypothetical protein
MATIRVSFIILLVNILTCDVCISRRAGGRHHVLPLSADLQVRARKLGFDCLTPIRWMKVSNIKLELDARPGLAPGQRTTRHLIARAVARLIRAGGRKTEADAAHLLEGIAVIAYDPGTGTVDLELPAPGSGLRWDEFVDALAKAYEARFEA